MLCKTCCKRIFLEARAELILDAQRRALNKYEREALNLLDYVQDGNFKAQVAAAAHQQHHKITKKKGLTRLQYMNDPAQYAQHQANIKARRAARNDLLNRETLKETDARIKKENALNQLSSEQVKLVRKKAEERAARKREREQQEQVQAQEEEQEKEQKEEQEQKKKKNE